MNKCCNPDQLQLALMNKGVKMNLDDFFLLSEDGLDCRLVLCRKVEPVLVQARSSLKPQLNALPAKHILNFKF
jgi:hypothetical protein